MKRDNRDPATSGLCVSESMTNSLMGAIVAVEFAAIVGWEVVVALSGSEGSGRSSASRSMLPIAVAILRARCHTL